jgi:endonuclease/exonuclease/phosphatase (EEP) superfamily protein YafD
MALIAAFAFDVLSLAVLALCLAPFAGFLKPELSARLTPLLMPASALAMILMPVGLFWPIDTHTTAIIILISAIISCLALFVPVFKPSARSKSGAMLFSLLQANILRTNKDANLLLRLIRKENPDVIALCEVTPDFAKKLEALNFDYPYHHVEPRNDSFGMGLWSKLPLIEAETLHLSRPDVVAIKADIDTPKAVIRFLSLHPHNPLKDTLARDAELDAAAAWVQKQSTPFLIVAGDFNATLFCRIFRRFIQNTKMMHARQGRNIAGSWPCFLPAGPWRIAIDHALSGDAIKVTDHRLLHQIGSDHLPLLTRFQLKLK